TDNFTERRRIACTILHYLVAMQRARSAGVPPAQPGDPSDSSPPTPPRDDDDEIDDDDREDLDQNDDDEDADADIVKAYTPTRPRPVHIHSDPGELPPPPKEFTFDPSHTPAQALKALLAASSTYPTGRRG